jgi:hypothetical protein
MNKIKILAVASLASIAFAGGDLWDFSILLSSDNCGKFCGQVHTPGAIYCWQENQQVPTNGYGRPCFDGSGGWWFGYADNRGEVKDASSGNKVYLDEEKCPEFFPPVAPSTYPAPKDPTPTEALGSIAIEKYVDASSNQDWISLLYDYKTGTTAPTHFLVKGYGLGDATEGLDVKFENPAGTDDKPTVSAIGFNWREKGKCPNKADFEDIVTENLTSRGTGLCIVYKADKEGVDVELGWDEEAYEYNTWVAKLPIATGWKTLNMKWENFRPSFDDGIEPTPLETALTEAEALKFASKNKSASPVSIHFQLKEVGWHGSCSGTAEEYTPSPTPIIGGKMASAYKFNMNGRMLSTNFAGFVQVVNLQGMVVAKKTLAEGEYLNLANLPVGIYMVRSEKHGIVQKIMVK